MAETMDAHRDGDCNTGGGCVETIPQGSVYINDLLAVVDGSMGTDHGLFPHCENCWVTIQNTVKEPSNVFAENIPMNYRTNIDSCGHPRAVGSPNVFINSFGESGALIDKNAPYIRPTGTDPAPPVPAGGQPNPPSGYEDNTPADVHVYENNDDPDGTLGPPPPNTTVRDVSDIEEDESEPAPAPTSIVADCSTVDALPASFTWTSVAPDFGTFAAGFQLSPNFKLEDLTIKTAVSNYPFLTSPTQASGLTQKQILGNLCVLAQQTLEPMLAKYGNFTITSGFRNKSGGSQHNRGQAADIQFLNFHNTGNTGQLYFNRAKDIRDCFQYDQLILEWFGRNPWIHISSIASGNRRQVLTQTSSSSFAPGLSQLRP